MFLRSRCWILTKPLPIFSHQSPSSIARFSSGSAEPSEKMEDAGEDRPKPQTTTPTHTPTGDIMTDSFGHGYSTRSDDDGFGGIYGGGNQSLGEKSGAEKDSSKKKQGSQVKQREGDGNE